MAIEELDIDGLDMDGNSGSDIMADTTQGDQRDMIEHLRSLKESLVLGQATAHNPGKCGLTACDRRKYPPREAEKAWDRQRRKS